MFNTRLAASAPPNDGRQPRRTRPAHFEQLEGRIFFAVDPAVTLLQELGGYGTSSAGYLLDLANGKSTTADPQAAKPIRPVASSRAVFAAAPKLSTTGPTSGSSGESLTSGGSGTLDGTTPTGQITRSPGDFRYILRPGTGFTGPTTQPAPVGDPAAQGYDAKAIARWDVVPYQTFDGTFNVGVVAFHMNDIDRVEFSVNGGQWTAVKSMTKNPQTDVYEYTATLRAADFADGPVEVRAVAWPKVGVARVLQGGTLASNGNNSLLLYANAHATLSAPVRYVSPTGNDANDGLTPQTPKKDIGLAIHDIKLATGSIEGATIYLMAGTHSFVSPTWPASADANFQRWVTLTNAPGTTQDQVIFNGNGGQEAGLTLLHLKNLTLHTPMISSGQDDAKFWVEDCLIDGVDRNDIKGNAPFGYGTQWRGGKWITGGRMTNVQNGPFGTTYLMRNIVTDTLLAHSFDNVLAAINITASDINPLGSGNHPDIGFYYGAETWENLILYGITTPNWDLQSDSQGFDFSGGNNTPSTVTWTDVAIVNTTISSGGGIARVLVLGGHWRHAYIKNSDFRGAAGWDTNPGNFSATDMVFENTVFRNYATGNIVSSPVFPGATYR